MWFFGAVIGLTLGGMIGGFAGAMFGAIIGLICGLAFGGLVKPASGASSPTKVHDIEVKIAHIYESLGDIHFRLEKLERVDRTVASPAARADVQTAASEIRAAVDELSASVAAIPAAARVADKKVEAAAAAAASPPPVPDSIAASVAELEKVVAALPASPPPVAAVALPTLAAAVSAPVGTPPPRAGEPAPAMAAAQSPVPPLTPPPPSPPVVEDGPNFIDRMLSGNIIAKLGVLLLFFGVGFLLKFAYDRGVFPPELRLLGVALGAGAMLFFGKRVLAKNRVYALILMGGAMGLLYLDTFFALKNFALISPVVAFALFFALGVAMTLMAVKLDAKVLVVLGLTGAFMAPILASTGSGSHVLLFSYYLLLNVFIVAVSWFKSWRALNLTGFIFTFAIALFWGHSNYQPAYFATVEPFLIAFFVLYVAIPIVFAHRQPPELKGFVDGTLIFGTPLSGAMMQAALTRGMGDNILAWSAAAVALMYGVLAWTLWRRNNMRVLAEAHLALAIVFGTAAPYFAFDAVPTFAFWALEGAAIVWLGCRQDRLLARLFGLVVQLAAAAYFVAKVSGTVENPWFNNITVGCALIAFSAWISAWLLKKFAANLREQEAVFEPFMIAWGCLWWLGGGVFAVLTALSHAQVGVVLLNAVAAMQILLFASLCFLCWELAGAALKWAKLRLVNVAHLPVMLVLATLQLTSTHAHPLAGLGAFAWPLTFVIFFLVIHRQRAAGVIAGELRYGAGWLLMFALATWEAAWRFDRQEFVWVWAIALVGMLAATLRYRLRELPSLAGDDASVDKPAPFSAFALGWGLLLWLGAAHGYLGLHLLGVDRFVAMLVYVAGTAVALEFAGGALRWSIMRQFSIVLPISMLWMAAELWLRASHPAANFGAVVWLVSFAAWLGVLWRQERDEIALLPDVQALAAFWLGTALLLWEVMWQCDTRGLSLAWRYAGFGAVVALATSALATLRRSESWPLAERDTLFEVFAIAPLLLAAAFWTFAANVSSNGDAPPFAYLPLLNPLDLAQLALLGGAYLAIRTIKGAEVKPLLETGLAVAAFFWVNGVLLRTMHQWAGVPFEWHALMRSVVVQAAFSLLWTSTALVLMIAAGKRASRMLWGAGALLLGVVVVKLFINDVANRGTIAGIVSFIGVGVLLLVIGYLAPMPPKAAEGAEAPKAAAE
jgi:uncharacterized membrane protein